MVNSKNLLVLFFLIWVVGHGRVRDCALNNQWIVGSDDGALERLCCRVVTEMVRLHPDYGVLLTFESGGLALARLAHCNSGSRTHVYHGALLNLHGKRRRGKI